MGVQSPSTLPSVSNDPLKAHCIGCRMGVERGYPKPLVIKFRNNIYSCFLELIFSLILPNPRTAIINPKQMPPPIISSVLIS